MNVKILLLAAMGAVLLLLSLSRVSAAVLYVDASGANPVAPYASWSNAANTIQDAVDAANVGDQILVTNGIYDSGGALSRDGATNRVNVPLAVAIQSVNGPVATIIDGGGLMRCVYMTNGATLSGFTLTNGSTLNYGAGVCCQSPAGVIVSNCIIVRNISGYVGGGANFGTLVDCSLFGNTAAQAGGGAASSYLLNCLVISNSCPGAGPYGGGLAYGGGLSYANATNCAVCGNSVNGYGGGAANGTMVNCTVTGNKATSGGGTYDVNQVNCINYFNFSQPNTNYIGGLYSYCCTVPLPSGVGNISMDPMLVTAFLIGTNSPCRGHGNPSATTGVDIDGNLWANPPSIGCNEPYSGTITGPVNVSVWGSATNQPEGYSANFQANISGQVSYSTWNFGDGTVVTNEPYISHTWSSVGGYPVVLTAFNDSNPAGQAATNFVNVYQPMVYYVVATNPAPVAPYDTWAKAATNIQNAIDVAIPGGLVLVSNGVYRAGQRISSDGGTNRVIVSAPITIQSVNGSGATLIDGGNTVRCHYLTNGATLNGFTLTNGNAYNFNGGGMYSPSTNSFALNCLFTRDTTGAGNGGAIYSGTVSNCLLAFNTTHGNTAVAYSSVLENCTICSNSTGGASACTLYGCLICSNNGYGCYGCTLYNCLVTSNFDTGLSHCAATACKIFANGVFGPDGFGGGACYGTLTNCLIVGNYSGNGGGAAFATLVNCTIVSNFSGAYSSIAVGGVSDCSLRNSIIYYNSNYTNIANYDYSGPQFPLPQLVNCCTYPLPANGADNFTNLPLFVNSAAGDYHLQSESPCINAGNNALVFTAVDLDGNPRIKGGTVDVGAYEYQSPASIIPYAWLEQYGLPIDGSVDYLDLDGTGMLNWQKAIAGLNPTNPASVLVMLTPVVTNNSQGVIVSWDSVTNRLYYLQRSSDMTAQPPFSTIQAGFLGQTGTMSATDATATNGGPYFYRVGVQ